MTEIIGYIAMVFTGITLGMLGSGGSIFTIPILVYLFGMTPLVATTNSLLIVGVTALIGAIRYAIKGAVSGKTVFFFTIPGFLGIYLARNIVLPWLPDPIFSVLFITLTKGTLVMLIFSVLMLMASIAMFKKKLMRADEHSRFPPFLVMMFQGFCVGFATGFVGIGGGFLIIPVLIHLIDLPMPIAVGTSLFIIAINAVCGFGISYMNGSHVDLNLIGSIVVATLIGLSIGIALSKIILEDTLKITFAILVFIVGTIVFFDQIRSLFMS